MASQGASDNERLLAAARSDNDDLLLEVFENEGNFDINFQDGLGNTALHYAVAHGSANVLEHILTHRECDVDPVNRLERATPLHLAVKARDLDPEVRKYIVESLLDAGANMNVQDKNGEKAIAFLDDRRRGDKEIIALFRRAQALASISADDMASDDDINIASGSDE